MTGTVGATVTGTAVAVAGAGMLITGVPGSGKSDIALALIDTGALLVADDSVRIEASGDRLMLSAPPGGAYRIALRDLGVLTVSTAIDEAPLSLIVRLDLSRPAAIGEPRLDRMALLPGCPLEVPCLTIRPDGPAIAAKLLLALERWGL